MHVSLHDAREASAVARVAYVVCGTVPDGAIVSLQGRSEYVELSAYVEHDDVQKAIHGKQCRGTEQRFK